MYNEYGEEDSSFCEKGLDNGLKSLLDPFLTTISQITETHGLQTSVAVFLQNMPQDWKEDETRRTRPTQDELVTLRDDNIWNEHLLSALINNDTPKDWQLHIQQMKVRCFHNNRFEKNTITTPEGIYTILTNPIPVVCNENSVIGCLIIILKGDHSLPDDLNDVLKIYSRIISNWVSKYEECFYSRKKVVNQIIEIEEEFQKILLYDNRTYDIEFLPIGVEPSLPDETINVDN